MAAKTVTSWSNALDEPGPFNIDAPKDDQCGLFDAPNDSQFATNESVFASPEAFDLTDPVRKYHSRLCPESSPCPSLHLEPYSFCALPHHTLAG